MTTTSEDMERQDRIRARAHAIWAQEGKPEGRHLAHWRRAKRLVTAEELRAMAAALDGGAVPQLKIKAYFDHVIISGKVREDLRPGEMEAVHRLLMAEQRGVLEILTSRDAWPEQERKGDPAVRVRGRQDRTRPPMARDNLGLLRIEHWQDRDGVFVARPVETEVVDAPLFVELANAGLEPADARHLMYAVANRCDRYVTVGADFDSRPFLKTLCRGLIILKPSELAAEIAVA